MGWASASRVSICIHPVHAPASEGYARLLEGLLASDLERLGVKARRAGGVGDCGAVLVLLATGGTERILLEALDSIPRGVPTAVAAHPAANSAASLAEVWRDLEGRGVAPAVLGPLGVGHPDTLATLASLVSGLRAAAATRGARLGVIGDPAPWLPHDASGLAERLGVRVTRIPVGELLEALPREPPKPPEWLVGAALRVRAGGEALSRAMAVYWALKRLAGERGLDMLAPSCPSFMEEAGSNACLAMALLNMEGITVGCEGDAAATIALHLAQAAAGRPGFLANTAWLGAGRILLAHCNAPPSMGLAFSVERHVLTGNSPTLAVWFPEGLRVTIAQARWDGGLLAVAEGVIESGAPWRGRQCESQMLVRVDGLEEPLGGGNHAAVVTGPHSRALRVAWTILNPSGSRLPPGAPP